MPSLVDYFSDELVIAMIRVWPSVSPNSYRRMKVVDFAFVSLKVQRSVLKELETTHPFIFGEVRAYAVYEKGGR